MNAVLQSPGFAAHAKALANVKNWAEEARIAREARFNERAIEEARKFKVPAIDRDHVRFEWEGGLAAPVVCHLEYEPAEGDNWNTPYYPALLKLRAAYLRGVNVIEWMDKDGINVIDEIEDKAAAWLEKQRRGGAV